MPANTKAIVQSVSAIGLKYLELEKGTSHQTLKPGTTIPVSQTREPVDIVSLFNMFDQKTRTAIQNNSINFGDGLAGRGLGLNETIATLRPLVTNAIPVLRNIVAPQTGFRNFFPALDRVASQMAPVADTNAALYRELDTFFSAWAGVAPSLEQAIEGRPGSACASYVLATVRGAVCREGHRVHALAAPECARSASRSPRSWDTRSLWARSICAPPRR